MAQETELGTFTVRVFTPVGLLFEGEASSVKLPLSDGEAGILVNHRQYTGLIGTGIMEFKDSLSGTVKRLVLDGGFCSYAANVLTVLADSAALPESIDRDSYASDREVLQKRLQDGHRDHPEQLVAYSKLKRIEAIDRLISH